MSGVESVVVAAGVGATFHLFRFAADLISEASTRNSKEDEPKDVSSSNSNSNTTVKPQGGGAVTTARKNTNRSSTRVFNGRLSMGRNLNMLSLAPRNPSATATATTGIGLGISEHTVQSLEAGVLSLGPEEEAKKGLKKTIPLLTIIEATTQRTHTTAHKHKG
jgi:hypothetical protein